MPAAISWIAKKVEIYSYRSHRLGGETMAQAKPACLKFRAAILPLRTPTSERSAALPSSSQLDELDLDAASGAVVRGFYGLNVAGWRRET